MISERLTDLISDALKRDLSEAELKTYLAIMITAGRGSATAPTDSAVAPVELAELAGIKEDTGRKARNALAKFGLIQSVQPASGVTHIRMLAAAPADAGISTFTFDDPAPAGAGADRERRFPTLNGLSVRSSEEAVLAAALATAGLSFAYEMPYDQIISGHEWKGATCDFVIRYEARAQGALAGAAARHGPPILTTKRILVEFGGLSHRRKHEEQLARKASAAAGARLPFFIVRSVAEIPDAIKRIKETMEREQGGGFVPLYNQPKWNAARAAADAKAAARAAAGLDDFRFRELDDALREASRRAGAAASAVDRSHTALEAGAVAEAHAALSEVPSNLDTAAKVFVARVDRALLRMVNPSRADLLDAADVARRAEVKKAEQQEDELAEFKTWKVERERKAALAALDAEYEAKKSALKASATAPARNDEDEQDDERTRDHDRTEELAEYGIGILDEGERDRLTVIVEAEEVSDDSLLHLSGVL